LIIISRIITALILGLVGFQIGQSAEIKGELPSYAEQAARFGGLIVIGAITGFIVGGLLGKLLERGLVQVREGLRARTGAELVVGAFGLIVGLVVSFLISLPIRRLEFVGIYMLLPITLIVSYLFAELAAIKHAEILRLVGVRTERTGAPGKLLDSSALIDGRVFDVVEAGFLEGELIVPVFVLEELQLVADSSDDLRRARGRRGLDVVQKLRKQRLVTTPSDDYKDLTGVDAKLVRLASEHGYSIMTTDFNLGKVAQIQQVKVLNVNELANAMKPDFVPGESFRLKVIREGKESGQGVGYLDDGTMVIVEDGAASMGEKIEVEVASVLQSPSGRLVFTKVASPPDPRG
jgi:uncharacterized protein YacL